MKAIIFGILLMLGWGTQCQGSDGREQTTRITSRQHYQLILDSIDDVFGTPAPHHRQAIEYFYKNSPSLSRLRDKFVSWYCVGLFSLAGSLVAHDPRYIDNPIYSYGMGLVSIAGFSFAISNRILYVMETAKRKKMEDYFHIYDLRDRLRKRTIEEALQQGIILHDSNPEGIV